jgi:recombination protein RecA
MAKKTNEEPLSINEALEKELATHKLTNLVKLADNFCDMSVNCVSTGLPQLDFILHPQKRGFPLGRDIEIYSREPEVGKTSLAMHLLAAAQKEHMRVAAADIERTMTDELFKLVQIVTDPFEDPSIYALRLMRTEDDSIPAEQWLEYVKTLSKLFDLIVVDSVAALEKKADMEKDVDDAKGVGGVSKLLSEFTRSNITKRAAVIWINQTRQKIGGYSPNGAVQYGTTGGRALPFFTSIRLELSMVEKLKVGENDPFGMKIKVFTAKNKIAPPFRTCLLTYLFDKGFSQHYDYFELAEKVGAIEKSGSWLSFKDFRIQGKMNFVTAMEEKPELFQAIKTIVDGEDVVEEEIESQSKENQAA